MSIRRSLPLLCTLGLSAAATLVTAAPARANLTICNKSNQRTNVARAWLNNNWQAEGWFYVQPGECRNILTNEARFPTAHLYIMNDQGSPWRLEQPDGALPTRSICVKKVKFAHTNASGNCIQNMFPLPFQKIPIRRAFTVNLT